MLSYTPMSEETKVEVPAKFAALVETIEKLSIIDLAELVKVLESKFGVSAAAPVMMAGGAGAAAAEEKVAFDVELTSIGDNKINVIKAVRELTGLGLAEAKAVVDGAPKVVKAGLDKAAAEDMKKKLEAAGAKATIK